MLPSLCAERPYQARRASRPLGSGTTANAPAVACIRMLCRNPPPETRGCSVPPDPLPPTRTLGRDADLREGGQPRPEAGAARRQRRDGRCDRVCRSLRAIAPSSVITLLPFAG
jgi:hypothetical protein